MSKRKRKRDEPQLTPDLPEVEPRCPVFGRCGGCRLQHLDIEVQRAEKGRLLREAFAAADLAPQEWLPVLGDDPWHYRGRARWSVRLVRKKDAVLVGFRETHPRYVTDMTACPILPEAASDLILPLRELFKTMSIPDQIPQVEVVALPRPVGLVIRHLAPLTDEDLAKLTAFAEEHDARIYLQSKGYDTIKPLQPGQSHTMSYTLPGFDVELDFHPAHFTQVNLEVNRLLVSRVIDALELQDGDRVVDCYCGIGNFSLPAARRGAKVLGLEVAEGQVRQAAANAMKNELATRCRFREVDLDTQPELARGDILSADKLVIDPPRSGAASIVSALAPGTGPQRIVYVSCNPETLVRDTNRLVGRKGYKLEAAGLVDMFPHTFHSEAVAVFGR